MDINDAIIDISKDLLDMKSRFPYLNRSQSFCVHTIISISYVMKDGLNLLLKVTDTTMYVVTEVIIAKNI